MKKEYDKGVDAVYSKTEREEILVRMKTASAQFYRAATHSHCHSFIEFTGFINEFIKLCEEAQQLDVDFTQTNVHSQDATLPMKPHHAAYLGEKFGCIFAGTFAKNPKLLEIFIEAMKKG